MLLVFVALISCTQKGDIVPSIKLSKNVVTMGSVVEAEYSFNLPANSKIPDYDGIIFVHFLDPDHNIVFTDDHKPEKPTSQWKAGENYTYKRLIFIPSDILSGEYTIRLGIYDPSGKRERIPLNAKEIKDRAYELAKLTIKAPLWDLVKYEDGWYEPEKSAEDPFIQWRWTKSKAVAYLLNPIKDTKLYLSLEGNPEYAPNKELKAIIKINDNEVEQINMENDKKIDKTILISKDLSKADKYIKFEIDVSSTFVPAKVIQTNDDRELGVKIYRLVIEDW
jgi:hypothetical protein